MFFPILTKGALTLEHTEDLAFPKMIFLNTQQKKKVAYFSVLPNIAVGMLNSKGNQETALSELIDKEYGNCGIGIDVVYNTPISSSFDFSLGFGLESFNFSTEYDIQLPYKIEDEMTNGGVGYIDFEHSLPTAFGNTDTSLRLSRARTSDILDEPSVDLDFNTNHNFIVLSLPLGLSYKFNQKRSFFTLGLKVRPIYILNAHSSIRSVFSYHSAIDAVNNVSTSSYEDLRKLNVGVGFDLGYNLFLSERSGLNFNVGVQDYLLDFYSVGDFSSSVRKINMGMGFFYSM